MNMLLVNPWIYDFKAFDYWMKPTGLLYLSSVFKKSGCRVSFIDCLDRSDADINLKDCNFGCGKYRSFEIKKPLEYNNIPRKWQRFGISEEKFIEKCRKLQIPDLICVTSCMTYWYPGVFKAIDILKNIFCDVPVILGGIYATLCNKHAELSGADMIINRFNLHDFAKELKDRFQITINIEKDLDIFNFMPDLSVYGKLNYATLLTSRGCPYNCSYCASRIINNRFIQRDTDSVIAELKNIIENYNVRDIAIYDDALLCKAENHFDKIFSKVIKKNISCRFHTPNGLHASLINEERAKLMFDSGFKTIKLSLESVDKDFQKISGGKVDCWNFEKSVYNLKRAGFSGKDISAYLMIGLPDQDINEIEEGMKFINELKIKINLTQYSPIPETKLSEKIDKKYIEEPLYHNNTYWFYNNKDISIENMRSLIIYAKLLNNQI